MVFRRWCAGDGEVTTPRLSSVRASRGNQGSNGLERETGEGPSYSDHGGLNSGEVPHMATVAKSANAALPSLK
jgi:hypothetical protein